MTQADARSIVRAATAVVSAPGRGRHTSGRYPDWQQGTTGSRGPDLERVGCELALEQLDHLARRQAVADQNGLVRRTVVPSGGDHAFDLCGGHSGDRSGHGHDCRRRRRICGRALAEASIAAPRPRLARQGRVKCVRKQQCSPRGNNRASMPYFYSRMVLISVKLRLAPGLRMMLFLLSLPMFLPLWLALSR